MALLADFTESGDTDPLFANTDASQYGFLAGSTTPAHPFTDVFTRDSGNTRHGTYSIRVTGFRNGYSANSSANLNVRVYPTWGAAQKVVPGGEEWYGWSWWFPTNFTGTGSWGSIMEAYTADNRDLWPTYGAGAWDVTESTKLKIYFKTGKLPSPGSAGFDPLPPPDGYNATEILLGPGAPRPFTKAVWHDFYMHITWVSGQVSPFNGIWDIWHREEGGVFEKLYSNRNDGSALINRAPHPTLYWNAANGTPPTGGRAIYMMYRGISSFDLGTDVIYWADGFRRTQSETLMLAGFPSTGGSVTSPPDPVAGRSRMGVTLPGTLATTTVDGKRGIKRDSIPASSEIDIHTFYAWIKGPASGGSQTFKAVVYDHTSANPGALKGASAEIVVAQGASEAWVQFTPASPIRVTAPAFIGLISGGPGISELGTHPQTSGLYSNADTYSDGPADPFGSPNVGDIDLSICADYTIVTDSIAPTLSTAVVINSLITLTFDEILDATSVPDESAFLVRVNSVSRSLNNDLTVSGANVTFSLISSIAVFDVIDFDYTVPGIGKLRDIAPTPNNAANITNSTITNATPQPPFFEPFGNSPPLGRVRVGRGAGW